MHFLPSLPWVEPLDLAAGLMEDSREEHWVLLYSGIQTSYSGRYSYLAFNMKNIVQADDFESLAKHLTDQSPRYSNAWFGYLGYGLKDTLEELTKDQAGWMQLPPLTMMQFSTILVFDHETKTLSAWSEHPVPVLPTPVSAAVLYPNRVHCFRSNMSRNSYLAKVGTIIEHIHNGDLYQANLTRKFSGNFTQPPAPFAIYRRLCEVSPAPYSSFIKLKNKYILSSSPELFLHIDESGHIRTRPIKGTSARYNDEAEDQKSLATLAESPKDRAENLMIVDLMRNDLSRACIAGSVATPALFEVTSHASVHHMSSTVTGQKRSGCSTLEAIARCFPPGSMTGAPKIRAMKLCSELEQLERGVYSGALGWLGGDGSAELSVVIRTLLIQDQQFEFQVGGGIVADSIPEAELKETFDKSRGIVNCLGISTEEIEAL